MSRLSARAIALVGFTGCALLVGLAYVLQYGMGLQPCPFCLLQRWVLMLAAVIFLFSALLPSLSWQRLGLGLNTLLILFGGALAGRQIWLQHLPADKVPACGPSLDFMLANFPWHQTLRILYNGTGECAEITFRFLGLSLPIWSLLGFLLLGLITLCGLFSRR